LAFFACKKELFRKIGFFDENFVPGGFEDLDFMLRVKEANLGIFVTREAESIIDSESSWRSGFSKGKARTALRYFHRKWHSFRNLAQRQLLDPKYDYDLGPSTNETFLSWSHSKVGELSIDDNRLNKPPYHMTQIHRRKIRWQTYRSYLRLNSYSLTFCPSIILNSLNDIENLSFLEISKMRVAFTRTNSANKTKINLKGIDEISYIKHVKAYISKNNDSSFDIVHINNVSNFQQAVKIINTISVKCNKILFIDNCIPFDKTSISDCGDLYKVLYYLMKETNVEVISSISSLGMTFIKMPISKIVIPKKYHNVSYEEFEDFIKDKKKYNLDEMVQIVKGWTE
jgi:hypothetical protein